MHRPTLPPGGRYGGGRGSDLSKPKEFIAFLTCRRQWLCADRLPVMYEPSISHLPAVHPQKTNGIH